MQPFRLSRIDEESLHESAHSENESYRLTFTDHVRIILQVLRDFLLRLCRTVTRGDRPFVI